MTNNSAVFLQGRLMGHVTVMSLTASVGLMGLFAVDFIDMIFIAMLGNPALAAAVGYAGAVLFFTNAINIGLSIAAGSLVSRAIGADRMQAARDFATNVALIGMVIGIAVPQLVLFQLDSILDLLVVEGETRRLASVYLAIVLPSMPLMALSMIGSSILRAHGDARRSMRVMLIGGIVNAVLDPLFIFTFGWGLEGAAWASVIGRTAMFVFAMSIAIRVHRGFAVPRFASVLRDLRQVMGMATPAVLTNIATPLGAVFVTREMATYGTDAVAGMAIIQRLTPLAFAVVLALSGAIGPIIGQNFGASRMDRVRQTFSAGILFVGLYVLAVMAILFLAKDFIADIFMAEGITRELIYVFCSGLAIASFFNGVIFVTNASFNNVGHPTYSTWINWGRHTIGVWPFVIIGSMLFGAPGVLIGQAAGGVVFAGIAVFTAQRVFNRLSQPCPVDPFASHRRDHELCNQGRW